MALCFPMTASVSHTNTPRDAAVAADFQGAAIEMAYNIVGECLRRCGVVHVQQLQHTLMQLGAPTQTL